MKNKNLSKFNITVLLLTFLASNFAMGQDDLDVFKKNSPDWKTDFSIHSIDFSEVMGGGPPRDGIPSIDKPKFVSIKEAKKWLGFENPVVSLKINGVTKAYPLEILI